MNTQYLKEFMALAECGNFSDAAAQLYISQSSLSKHIRALEAELGYEVLLRTNKGVELNEYGTLLLKYAKQLFSMESRLMHDLENQSSSPDTAIQIASEYARLDWLFDLFHQKHPEFVPSLELCKPGFAKEMLRRDEVELAFAGHYSAADSDLFYIPFNLEDLYCVCPSDHWVAQRESITLRELSQETFAMTSRRVSHTGNCIRMCQQAGFMPKVSCYVGLESNLIGYVRRGLGISLLYLRPDQFGHIPGITLVRVEPRHSVVGALCYKKDAKMSSGAEALLDFVASLSK